MSTTVATTSKGKAQMEMNPRGIPKAPFVANVEEHIGGRDGSVEDVMKQFQETSAKYRYMDVNLQQRKKGLSTKIPDIEQTLNVVLFLQRRRQKALGQPMLEEENTGGDEIDEDDDDLDDELDGDEEGKDEKLKTLFELNDTLYAEAEIQETGEVGLWLGASTMLLYPLQEAAELLTSKLASAKKQLEETVEDLEWIREQVTVMEVNFARVHNWDVKRRREQKNANGPGAIAAAPPRKKIGGDDEEDDDEEDDDE